MKKVLFLLIAITLLFVSCDPSLFEDPEVNKCTHEDFTVEFTNTCTQDGKSIYRCKNCSYVVEYPASKNPAFHTWVEGEVIEEATCEKDGKVKITCSSCDLPGVRTIRKDSVSHPYSNVWKSDSTGHWHETTCSHNLTTEKQAHNFQMDTIVPPTCQNAGKADYECSDCGYKYEGDIPASELFHELGNKGTFIDSTCTEDGSQTGICKNCNVEVTLVVKAKGHLWDTGVRVEPTATEEGTITYHCQRDNCDASYTEVLHNWTNENVLLAATCSNTGIIEHECCVCGLKEQYETPKDPNVHPHEDDWTYGDFCHWKENTCEHVLETEEKFGYGDHILDTLVHEILPTCSTYGTNTRTCEVCGKVNVYNRVPFDPNNHEYSEDWDGNDTHHWRLKTCSCTVAEASRTDYEEHTFGEVTVKTPSTCKTHGVGEKTCSKCNRTVEVALALDPTKHEFNDYWSHNDTHHWHSASCSHAALREDLGEHTWENEVIKYPTCSSTGTTKHTRTGCDYSYNETTAKNPDSHEHDENSWQTDEDGHHWHDNTCSCTLGKEDKPGYSDHTPDSSKDVVISEGTCLVDGKIQHTCEDCGKVYIEIIDHESIEHVLRDRPDGLKECELCGEVMYFYCHNRNGVSILSRVGELNMGQVVVEELVVPAYCYTWDYSEYKKVDYLESINSMLFDKLIVSDGITKIGYRALAERGQMTSLFLPRGLVEIEQEAFKACPSLEQIVLPKSLTTVGKSAFESCNNLDRIFYEGDLNDWQKVNEDQKAFNTTSERKFFWEVDYDDLEDNE